MKLLLFSDLHLSENHTKSIVEQSKNVDIVIGAGDYCSLRRNLDQVIGWLSVITTPTLLVPGNSESYEELVNACKSWPGSQVLHGNGTDIHGIHFFGIGGGIPITPFGSWSYDFSEKEAEILLKDCPAKGVLISHSPPKGILDRSSFGMHLGSKSIRNVIHEKYPKLVVCGHIHESGGKIDKVDETVVINAGPHGVIYELNDQ